MKRILILAISALVVLVGLRRPSLSGGEATRRQDESRTLAQINSYAATLFELAGERFSAHAKRGEKWILTVHEWTKDPEVTKYSNNKYVIVSLPAQEWQTEGFCLYATHYNNRWMEDADRMVINTGRYKEAREIYNLLAHFDACGSLREHLSRRLEILEKLEKGEQSEVTLSRFKELYEDIGPSYIDGLEDRPATIVTNLLELPVYPLFTSGNRSNVVPHLQKN